MQEYFGTPEKTTMIGRDAKRENGLRNLAMYYQSLFDIEENINHYSDRDYQKAKRKYIRYLMKSRTA